MVFIFATPIYVFLFPCVFFSLFIFPIFFLYCFLSFLIVSLFVFAFFLFRSAASFICILLRFPNPLLKQTVSCLEWSVSVKFAVYTCHSLTGACLRSESFSASIFIHSSLNIAAMYIGNRRWHLKSFKISTCIDNCNPYSDPNVNRDLSLTTRKRSMKWHWRHSKIKM